MQADQIVCMKCGYDMKANAVRRPEVGVHELTGPVLLPELNTPGRGSVQGLLVIGGVLMLGTVIFSGAGAQALGGLKIVGSSVLAAYQIAVHTGTGVLALVIGARLTEHRLSRIDLGAARMFVAYSLLALLTAIPTGMPLYAAIPLQWCAGLLLYWSSLRFFFRKDNHVSGLIAGTHAILWCVVSFGTYLSSWLAAPSAPSP